MSFLKRRGTEEFQLSLFPEVSVMKKRKKLTRKKSRRVFQRTANRTHRFNLQSISSLPMRGGIRL